MLSKLLFSVAGASAQERYWIAKLSTATNDEYVNGVSVTSSGGAAFAGYYTNSTGYALIGSLNASGALAWQRTLGSVADTQIGRDVCIDSAGNLYVLITEVAGSNKIYVASYTSAGTLRWQRSITNALAEKIAIDSLSNVYIAGYWTTSGVDGGFIAKYNSSGTLQWQKELRTSAAIRFTGLTIDSSDNPVVCGYYEPFRRRLLTVKYNASGTVQFQRTVYSSSDWYALAITADSLGNTFVFGRGGSFGAQLVCLKYNSSGTLGATNFISRDIQLNTIDAAVDASNNVYVLTTDNIGTYFGTDRRTDFYAVKLDGSLSISWQRYLGTTNGDTSKSVAVFGDSAMYFAGLTYSSVSTAPNGLIARLPTSGDRTGTYGSYFYNSASWSTTSGSYSEVTPSFSDSTTTLVEAASTLTDAAVTLTTTKTDL